MQSSLIWAHITRPVRVAAVLASLSAIVLGGFFISRAHANANLSIAPPAAAYLHGTYTLQWSIASTTGLTSVALDYSPVTGTSTYTNLITLSTPTNSGSYNWNTVTGSNAVGDGSYQVFLTDSPANEASLPITVKIDNTPPIASTTSVSPVAPNGTNGWYTSVPSITLGCSDPVVNGVSSGCSGITYAWYNASTGAMVTASTTAPGASVTINAPEGDNNLVYYASDNAQNNAGAHNTSAPHTAEFKVDTVAPTITSYTLNGSSSDVYFNPSATSTVIALTASEPVNWTSVEIQSATSSSVHKVFYPTSDGQATTTIIWNGSLSGGGTAPDGEYVITYHIKDLAGNDTNTETSGTPLSNPKLFVDTQAPTISNFTSPAANHIYTSDNLLTFTPADTGGVGTTPVTCGYSLNGAATTTLPCTSGTAVASSTVSGLTEGRNTLQLSVTDAAGNSVSEAPVSFIYDSNHTLTVSNAPSDHADFSTIGAAVAASDAAGLSGETIDVYPGTYNENVTLDNAFTLQSHTGTASDVTINGQVELSADNDAVKNITVNNPNGTFGVLINGVNDASVTGNTVTNIGTGSATGNVWAIYYQSHTSGDTSGVTISNNTISNVGSGSNGSNGGIGVGDSLGAGNITSVTIENNTISHVVASASKGAYGILVNHGASALGTTGVTIENNTIADLGGPSSWVTAIGLEGPTPSASVTGNTISAIENTGGTYPGTAFNLEQNPDAGSVGIHKNSVDNATVPVFVSNKATSTSVDATDNWWGTAVYSTIAGKMFNAPLPGTVTFDPYYVNSAMTMLSNAPVSAVYVDPTYTDGGTDGGHIFGYDAFSTIQDGVNASALSSGGTVHVAAGTYAESVSVTRSLTIDGANVGVAGSSASRGSESIVSKQMNIDTNNVTVDGLSFANAGSQLNIASSTAILAGDVVQNNVFSGYSSVGVPTSNAGNLLVKNNLFENAAANSEAIQFKADGMPGGCDGTTLADNTFTAAGTNGGADANFSCTGSASNDVTVTGNTDTDNTNGTSFAAFAGIANNLLVANNTATTSGSNLYFWGGMTGSTTIADNHIAGGSSSSGISVHDSLDGANTGTFTIAGNTIDSSGYGIYIASGALTGGAMNASGNEISGNTTYGIDNNDSSVMVNAEKNWWGDPTGPYNLAKNPNGLANKVSDYVDFSPFCTDSGCANFGSIDPIAQLALTADPTSVALPLPSVITAKAEDANGYTVVNDNGSTQIHFSTDGGATLSSLYVDLGADGLATTSVSNTVTGVVQVGAEVVGASPAVTATTEVTFTPGDTTPPTVTSVSPAGSATGVAVSVIPQVDFSEALAQATVDSTNVYLETSTTTVPATVALVEGGTRVTITPDAPLAYGTQYTLVVTTGITDLSGNALASQYTSTFTTASAPVSVPVITDVHTSLVGATTATIQWTTDQPTNGAVDYGLTSGYGMSSSTSATSTTHSVTITGLTPSTTYHFRVRSTNADGGTAASTDNIFTTAVDNSSAVLAVTGIDALSTYAMPDNSFADGWSWTFHVTVPTGQNYLAMKFSDFLSGTGTIPAAGNIEYFSPQSSLHDSTSTAVSIAGAGAYPGALLLDGADLDPSTPGTQAEVTVLVKVPTTATGGSYSASYGVKSSDTAF